MDVRAIAMGELDQEAAPQVEQGFRVFISEDAFDRAVERGSADTTREIGGVLVGVLRRDQAGPYVRVDTTIDALHAEEKGAELTFTHATWDHIHEQMDAVHADKRVLGWYHTHPGFGVFLSDRDTFIHASFFDLPFQIALVYDPKSREHGVFTWREGELVRCRRYWIGPHEHTWDGAHAAAGEDRRGGAEARPVAPVMPPSMHEDGAGRVDFLTLGLFGLLVLLLGGFGGWWFGSRSTADVVARAEVEIARAQTRGALDMVKSLNLELLEVVQASLSDDSVRRHSGEIEAALERARSLLPPAGASARTTSTTTTPTTTTPTTTPATTTTTPAAPTTTPAPGGAGTASPAAGYTQEVRERVLAEIEAARRHSRALGNERAALRTALEHVMANVRTRGRREADDPKALRRQQNALGQLYADLAADFRKDGDNERAASYLVRAAAIDPGNFERYEAALRAFDNDTPLVRPRSRGRAAPTRQRGQGRAPDEQ